jgi:hypothetical protein
MKKLYFSALSIVFGLSLNAQTITQANHAPINGNQFTTYQCDSNFVVGAGGAGSTWNYPTLVTHTFVIDNYTSSIVSNTAYPNADVATASSTSNITFFKSTATELKNYGGFLNLNGVGAQVIYSSPFTAMAYPSSINTTTNSTTAGSLTAFGISGTFTGVATVLADGTGTLTLPLKTFTNVIRVVTTQSLYFVAAGVNGTVTQVTYDWYSLGDSRAPILKRVTSYVNAPPLASASTQTYATIQKNYQTVGVKEIENREEVALNVYPNPSSSAVNFVTDNTNAKSVIIYDITGKMIESQVLMNGKTNINVSNYNSGLYIYKLVNNSNTILKTGKITVTH